MRWVLVGCAVAATGLVAGLLAAGVRGVPAGGTVRPSPPAAATSSVAAALEVLHRWDARRAWAWEHQDARALRSLYVRGSRAGQRDVRLLRAYAARHLVVRRLRTQVFAVTVVRTAPARLLLRVFDRVAGGVLDDGATHRSLPPSPPVVRLVELWRAETWRVGDVRAVSGSG